MIEAVTWRCSLKKLFIKVPYHYIKYARTQVFSDPYFPLIRTESSILLLYGKVQGKWKFEFWHILCSAWFKEKHLQWSPNFSKVTNMWILQNFSEQLPYRTPPEDYFCQKQQPEVSCKKDVLKIFSIFSEKHLFRNLFLIKLQTFRSENLLKRDSSTGVFLWILRNF